MGWRPTSSSWRTSVIPTGLLDHWLFIQAWECGTRMHNRKAWQTILCIIIIDLCKAFDSFNRQKLFYFLTKQRWVYRKMINMWQNIYHGVQTCIKIRSIMTNLFLCLTGVGQDGIFSPWLFALFIKWMGLIRLCFCFSLLLYRNFVQTFGDSITMCFRARFLCFSSLNKNML